MVPGVDVASYQGTINWPSVAASGVGFAAVKATELDGAEYENPYLDAQASGARAAGLVVGYYHFAHPELNTPEVEAELFLRIVAPRLQPSDFVALDLESGADNLAAWALRWLQLVEAAIGYKPLLYCGPAFILEHSLVTPELAAYGLWLADWVATMPQPPANWPVIAIWQDSDAGSVPGVAGQVDTDLFNGTIDQLRLYGKPMPAPPPVKVFDDPARFTLISYIAGGSGSADIAQWIAQYGGA